MSGGKGVTTSDVPDGPWIEPVNSVRTPVASMIVTVRVSSGTSLANCHTTVAGAVSKVAPSDGELETNELCALATPTPSASATVVAAIAARNVVKVGRTAG